MTIKFDQAKKLYELGVRKKVESCYQNLPERVGIRTTPTPEQIAARYLYYAYNAEELMTMVDGDFRITVCDDKSVRISSVYYAETWEGATITEALGNKLIYDIEHGVVTVEEINA